MNAAAPTLRARDLEIERLRKANAELVEALKGLSDLYTFPWERVDAEQFERAHGVAHILLEMHKRGIT